MFVIRRMYVVVLLLVVSPYSSFGQGHIEVIMDARIEELIRRQGSASGSSTGVQINGYRLQLLFDSEKNKVDQARIQFAKLYPKVETYVKYNAPNYVLKVGDFRTQLEADRLKAEVGSLFPMSFVVREKINLPRID